MIQSRIGARDSFGDRLRSSRQRQRVDGRRLTQGDLAKAVGVERNTVSRWENGGMLPRDPSVIASLASVLDVTADWLIAGDRVGEAATRLHEGFRGQYLDPDIGELPSGTRAAAAAYINRLRESGCLPDQVSGAEALLLAGARNRVSARPFEERDDDQMRADVDAAWDMVVQILRREGIRP
jgi:transcriptional regulator with XRE-family HTH domain